MHFPLTHEILFVLVATLLTTHATDSSFVALRPNCVHACLASCRLILGLLASLEGLYHSSFGCSFEPLFLCLHCRLFALRLAPAPSASAREVGGIQLLGAEQLACLFVRCSGGSLNSAAGFEQWLRAMLIVRFLVELEQLRPRGAENLAAQAEPNDEVDDAPHGKQPNASVCGP